MTPVAIYVHTPFCPSKCGYCDFNSYAMSGEIMERTVQATVREIRTSPWVGRPAKTIFFGGGTPTYLAADQLIRILDAVRETHPTTEGIEITSEANPGTVDMPKFAAMRAAGFNRISLGAQSFQTDDLMRLGRVHAPDHVARAVAAARAAGFDRLNLDLMFALPGQSRRAWQNNLQTALSLRPDHLSLYCLTIEPNTRYYRLHLKGMLDLPDEEAQVAMYEDAVRLCAEFGLAQYEISNFARPGQECAHNLCYWRGEEYLAYGPGAVGCFAIGDGRRRRYTVMKHPERYCGVVEAWQEGATRESLWCEQEVLEEADQTLERLMLGIRLNEGVAVPVDAGSRRKLVSRGWLEDRPDRLVLTPAGRHFCSEVAAELA